MKVSLEEVSLKSAPHAFIDKRGEPVLIRILSERRQPDLLKMYLAYQPRNSFNNLPPIEDGACVMWVKKMIENAINVVALSFSDGVVGHVALFSMSDVLCELLIVVSPGHQGYGIGTELTRCAIQLAYEMGYQKIWLCVESGNMTARHVYSKCGFMYVEYDDNDDKEMSFDLVQYHRGMDGRIGDLVNRNAVSIHQDETCHTAYRRFLEYNVGALPVTNDNNNVVGILTATDLIRTINIDQVVRDVATKDVVVVCEECSVGKVVRLFQSRYLRCIPVVDSDKKFVGIVSRHEILLHIGEKIWSHVKELL